MSEGEDHAVYMKCVRTYVELAVMYVYVILHSMIYFWFSSFMAPFPGQTQDMKRMVSE